MKPGSYASLAVCRRALERGWRPSTTKRSSDWNKSRRRPQDELEAYYYIIR